MASWLKIPNLSESHAHAVDVWNPPLNLNTKAEHLLKAKSSLGDPFEKLTVVWDVMEITSLSVILLWKCQRLLSTGHLIAGLICRWPFVLVHMKEPSPCLRLLPSPSLNEKIRQPSIFSHVYHLFFNFQRKFKSDWMWNSWSFFPSDP